LELYDDKLFVKEWHFLSWKIEFPLRAKAKIRYRQDEQDCNIIRLKAENWRLKEDWKYLVKFDKKQRAITSGQICAVYLGDELVMSGVIE
jgi:tRNA-specific 2-thiouridylase